MIVETQSLTTIGVGASKTQTEPGDATLKIPNLILPVIEIVEPTQVSPLAQQVNTASFIRSAYASRNNVTSNQILFCTIGRGYWHLRFIWTHRFTWAAPVTFNTNGNFVLLVSPIGGISSSLATVLPAQSGSFTTRWENRILLRETAEIYIGVDATGAADFLETNLHINASKIL